MTCSRTYCFSHIPIFQNLKSKEFEKTSKRITCHVFKRGEYILLAGGIKKGIRKGLVKVVKLLPNDVLKQVFNIDAHILYDEQGTPVCFSYKLIRGILENTKKEKVLA